MEEMGWQNAPEGFHLEYFENIVECTKQALSIADVVGQGEQLVCDHPEDEQTWMRNGSASYCHKCGEMVKAN